VNKPDVINAIAAIAGRISSAVNVPVIPPKKPEDVFKETLKTTFEKVLTEAFNNLVETFKRTIVDNAQLPSVDLKIYNDISNLTNGVANNVTKELGRILFNDLHTGISAPHDKSYDLLVALNNDNNPSEITLFNTLCLLLKRNGTHGWNKVDFTDFDTATSAQFRVNLKKEPGGSGHVLFATTLPKVKKGVKAYYTETVSLNVESDTVDSEDYLRDLYMKVWTGALDSRKYAGGADPQFNEAVYKDTVVESLLKKQVNLNRDVRPKPVGNAFSTPLDEYFQEISGNQIWFRKGNKLFKQ
jgi:hypothetical protein